MMVNHTFKPQVTFLQIARAQKTRENRDTFLIEETKDTEYGEPIQVHTKHGP